MSNGATLLEVRDLEVQFKTDEGIVRAVNGVSYDLDQGRTLGIVGESGCGKSVSALSLLRLVPQPVGRIVNGEVQFRGRDLLQVSTAEMRQIRGEQIAMIFQDPMSSLNPVLTIGRQIDEAQQLHLGSSKGEARRHTVELLDHVGIPSPEDRVNDYPHQFSGGMQQRAMIAMAISCEPKLLIADEPTTALDVTIQAQVIELLGRLREELGMAVILITHDLALVAGFCEEIIVMYAGYIVERASASELFNSPKHPYTVSLLESIPSMTTERGTKLTAIPGAPPDMVHLPTGCPFAPRCTYVQDKCREELPPLDPLSYGHTLRCWVDVDSGKLR